ncbi:hypothetical protein SLEP1_g56201 [Rubroshorea leprosula]|uniref:AB hydrolase-1 domain-containing protein n=1 Tax=Rubroshorea leprosula TaxID=152421 RepID=A0AAV5MHU6_9ROSI|nr:hypothetical protein SLEP1_g56201 [Rubroshorea leprosula]
MLVTHAPPRWIKPLVLDGILSSLSPRIVSHRQTPAIKLLNSHYCRNSCRTIAMAAPKVDSSGESLPEHAAGKWYSVPDLLGKEDQPLPYLLFLQGGPGFESPRPTEGSGWILKACEEFRVILMDQRGTGLSIPLTTSSMLQFTSARDLADHLKHFRADSIVNAAEFIRVRLVPGSGPWTVLGQSYGGFCAVTYLSFAPQGLKQVLLTGGIPPIGDGCTADTVYGACFEQVARQNEKYYKRYPQDIEVVREVVNYLAESEGGGVPLSSGAILTPRGLQLLGLSGLGSSPGFERLHYLVWDPAIVPGAPKKISFYFLNAISLTIDWVLIQTHSMLLSTSQFTGASSRWSAQRLRAKHENKFDAIKAEGEGRPVLCTGEISEKATSLLNKPSAVAPRQVPECLRVNIQPSDELVMAANAIPLSDMAQSNRSGECTEQNEKEKARNWDVIKRNEASRTMRNTQIELGLTVN